MQKIAISIGDINGIGLEIALRAHKKISTICDPIYCVNHDILISASKRLNIPLPKDFTLYETAGKAAIKPGKTTAKSGKYSFDSFYDAVMLAKKNQADAIVTLPINKKAWEKAGINYVGHTDALRDIFKKDAIMMLGCNEMYVALYTEHIPLKEVPKKIKAKELTTFLLNFYQSVKMPKEHIAVLGLNPHAGDNGVLGNEEKKIKKAIKKANRIIRTYGHTDIQTYKLAVPDIAFTPNSRRNYKYFVAMYHDQGLAPLKALYFDESINVSLNLPVIRTSVDHGSAFDIAYQNRASLKSYINAVKEAVKLSTY